MGSQKLAWEFEEALTALSFYADWDEPHHVMYSIASNRIANDEYPDALGGGTDDVEAA